MTAMVTVVGGGAVVSSQALLGGKSGKAARISAIKGARYVLAELSGGAASGDISVKRIGKNLLIEQKAEGAELASLVIEDFYGSDGRLVGLGTDGEYLDYQAATEHGPADAAAMSDGASSLLTLVNGQSEGMANSFQFAEGGSTAFSSALAGVAAVAGGFAMSSNTSSTSKAQSAPAASSFMLKDAAAGELAGDPAQSAAEQPAMTVTDEVSGAELMESMPNISDEIVRVAAEVDAAEADANAIPESSVVEDANVDVELAPEAGDSKGRVRPGSTLTDGAVKAAGSVTAVSLDGVPVIDALIDKHGVIQGLIENGGYTDDGFPTITGKAEPGVKVHVYRGKYLLGNAVADENGDWSYTPSLPFPTGTHSITIVHQYPDSESSEPSAPYVFTVDKIPPAIPVITGIVDDEGRITGAITEQTITDDNRPTINGTGEAYAKVIIYDKGKEIGSTTVGADGRWSFTPDTPLADGVHMLSFSAMDRAGNFGQPGGVTEFVIDTRAEKINIYFADDDAGSVTGEVFSEGATDDSTPTLFGTATAGGIVKIYEGTVLLGQVTADVDGTWQFTPDFPLSEGAHSLYATVTLVAKGESGPSKLFKLEVDLTAPSQPTIEQVLDDVGTVKGPLQNGDITDDAHPTLQGKAEANSTVIIRDGDVEIGRVQANAAGEWSFTPEASLNVGAHSINVISLDKAGNASAPSEQFQFSVTLVSTVPAGAPIIVSIYDDIGLSKGTLGSGAVTDDDTPLISGKGEPNSIIVLKDNGVEIGRAQVDASGSWSLLPAKALPHGLHNLVATAVDMAGNVGGSSSVFGFRVVEYGGGGALENFNTMEPEAPVMHTKGVVLPTGVILSGQFGATEKGAVSVVGGPRPEDTYTALFVSAGKMKIELPTESSKVSFFQTATAGGYATYFDADGVQIGRESLPASGQWAAKTTFVAPEGKLIASMEISTTGTIYIDSLQWGNRYLTGVTISSAEEDGFGGRIIYGKVSGIAYLDPDTVVQVSTDGGKSWTNAVFSEGSWVAIQKDMPPGDWTAEVRVIDRPSGLSFGFSDTKLVETQGAGAPKITRIADAEGMYTAAKAADGSLIEVSVEGTGAKQGDLVHIRWGTVTFDHVLTKADIDAGHATVRMPSEQILLQGVKSDFSVTAQIIGKNGTIGELSKAYDVVGTYTVNSVANDTLFKDPVNNAYQGTGFKVTTGGVMTKTAATAGSHAGLTLSSASDQADALFTLDKPAREISLRLSGIDSEEGVKIQLFDVKGNLIEEQTIYGDATALHANAYTYIAKDERVDIGSFKILSNEASVTLDGFARKDVTHSVDTRNLNLIDSSTESYFGSDADDVVTLTMGAGSYFQGSTAGIHGGGGIDTLKITGTVASQMYQNSNMSSIEIIDFSDFRSTSVQIVSLNLSDVLRNGGTDIFYTGDTSRVQMMVKGANPKAMIYLYDPLVGGANVSESTGNIGGDLGNWVKKGEIAIGGATYVSYQHSTVAVEVLIQQGIGVGNSTRPEFLEVGVKSIRSSALFDVPDQHEESSILQPAGDELFGSETGLLGVDGAVNQVGGGAVHPVQSFGTDLLDQHHVMYAAY